MFTAHRLEDVKAINLFVLTYLKAVLSGELSDACYQLGLGVKEVQRLRDEMSMEAINGLVANTDKPIFQLRQEVLRLIEVPAGLVAKSSDSEWQ